MTGEENANLVAWGAETGLDNDSKKEKNLHITGY